MSKVTAIPDSMHTVTPHLVCANGSDAIAFYKQAVDLHLKLTHLLG